MGVFSVVLLVVFGIAAVLLVIVVLLQDEQSEGLGGIFGGSSSNQVGNRKGNILTKTTSVLGFVFLAVAFSLALINRQTGMDSIDNAAKAKAGQSTSVNWWDPAATPDPSAIQDPATDSTGDINTGALGATDLEAATASPAPAVSPAAQ